jgi:hypothetical protein
MTVIASAAATMMAAQVNTPAPAAAETPAASSDIKPILDAMSAIGSIIAAADNNTSENSAALKKETTGAATATQTPFADSPEAEYGPLQNEASKQVQENNGEPAVKKPRTLQKSVALIMAGAAAGAAIGGSASKNPKGAVAGAVAGGVAALIYDRVTHKNPGKI